MGVRVAVKHAPPTILATLIAGVLAADCGGGSPARPTPLALVTPVVTGRVTETLSDRPVVEASVAVDGAAPVQTDATGTFRIQTGVTPTRIVVSAPGYLTRDARVPSVGTITIDLIPDTPPFSLAFYRQIVRNGYDAPEALAPLRRWTRDPSVYLKTIDEAGAPIGDAQLDSVESAIRNVAEALTGGRIGLARVERGTDTREGQTGWITVKWLATNAGEYCATADVARDGGSINLNYKRGGGCSCGALPIRPRTVKHELGHALGLRHTDSTGDLMSGIATSGCDADPSPRERHHAAIAYLRPVGNLDVDVDPASSVSIQPLTILD